MGGTRSPLDHAITTLQQTHGCAPSIFGQCFYIFSELKEVEVLNYVQRYFIFILLTLLTGCCMATFTGFTQSEECCRMKGFKNPVSSKLLHHFFQSTFTMPVVCVLSFWTLWNQDIKNALSSLFYLLMTTILIENACTPPHQKSKEETGDSL